MLVYLTGASHSGSSIVDLILNNHSKIIGAGGLHRLSLNPDTRQCSCGETLMRCKVWSGRIKAVCELEQLNYENWFDSFPTTAIREKSVSNFINDVLYSLSNVRLIKSVSSFNRFSKKVKTSIVNSSRFADIVLAKENKSIVIDTSKNAIRMKAMTVFSPAKVIFLVRDGRAVVASAIRRKEGDIVKVSKRWKKSISNIQMLLEDLGHDRLLAIKYENFCDFPDRELRRICQFLEIPYEDEMMNLPEEVYHTIPGNPWLISKNSENDNQKIKISKDTRWETELTGSDLNKFNAIAGKLNSSLGYL